MGASSDSVVTSLGTAALAVRDGRPVWTTPAAAALLGDPVAPELLAHLLAAPGPEVNLAATGGPPRLGLARLACAGTVVLVLFDISDHIRARAEAEQRFDAFMRHCPAPAVVKDEHGRYAWANDAYFTTYRIDPTGWVGSRLADHAPPEVAEHAEALDRRVLDTGEPLRDTHRFELADGTEGEDVGVRFPLTTAGGTRLLGGIFLDVTEERRTRDRLARWRDRYRALFDRAPTGMVVTTGRGIVLDANLAFCRLVGVDLFALRGTDVLEISDPDEAAHELREISPLSRGDAPSVTFVKTYIRPSDGARVETEVTAIRVPAPDDEGSLVGMVVPQRSTEPSGVVLGPAQARVLELRAAGVGTARIASDLGMTRRGVDYHLQRLAASLGGTTSDIVARAYHLGVLDAGSWPPRVTGGHLHG